MKRWLIRVVGVVSLMLCAGTIWMWVRSYWFDDQVQRSTVGTVTTGEGKFNFDRLLWIGSSRGKVAVMTVDTKWPLTRSDDVPVSQWWWSEDNTSLKSVERRYSNWRRFLGFGFGSSKVTMAVAGTANPPMVPAGTVSSSSRCVVFPWGVVAAVFMIAPAWWAYLAAKERSRTARAIRGLCMHCGYDLRGAGGVCPECGQRGG